MTTLLHFPTAFFRRNPWVQKPRTQVNRIPYVDFLEPRTLLSTYYQYDVIAQTGTGNFVGLGKGPSINSSGEVAFQGTISRASDGQPVDNLFAYDPGTGAVRKVMSEAYELPNQGSLTTQYFGQNVLLTDQGKIGAYRSLSGRGYLWAQLPGSDDRWKYWLTTKTPYLESWTLPPSSGEGQASQLAASKTLPLLEFNPSFAYTQPTPLPTSSPFSAVFDDLSMNDSGQAVFAARRGTADIYIVTSSQPTGGVTQSSLGMSTNGNYVANPRIADNGNIVISTTNPNDTAVAGRILLFLNDLTLSGAQEIAGPSTGFTYIGPNPGISSDGSVVVFTGDRGSGPGVFASVDTGTGTRESCGSRARIAAQAGHMTNLEGPLSRTLVGTCGEIRYFSVHLMSTRVSP